MKRTAHAVAWVLLVVAALVLWPKSWGGTMTYVLTTGTSMQPSFNAGDLAVLRSADDYRVGDVVAYESEELGRVVMHRVLTEQDGTYTFQGDNNDFVDPDQVREDQVLGRLALRVPRVGTALAWLLTPVNLLLVVGALYLLLSDRRKPDAADAPPPAESLVLRVTGVQLPPGAVVADLVDEADLERVASRSGRPVLRDEQTGESWVDDGTVVYRHLPAQEQAPAQLADVVALPRPRRQVPQRRRSTETG